MTIDALNQQVDKLRRIPGGWPSELTYLATEKDNVVEVAINDAGTAREGVWKTIDPWGCAFLDKVKECTVKPIELTFSLRCPSTPIASGKYEALRRRVSYLAIANDLQVRLLKDNCVDALYTLKELTHRPEREKVRSYMDERSDKDTGRLEKDFQAYLFGKGLYDHSKSGIKRTNERLALFGDDFVGIRKKLFKVEREFPTGAFHDEVKECNRILPTEYVDLVTINKKGDVSVIELKFDDPKIEVIPQVLNYSLFFHSYRSQLTALLDERLDCSTAERKIVTYLVSNTFHARFKSVWRYYSRGPLAIKQVIMGYMPDQG
jgi:hypothetical protein